MNGIVKEKNILFGPIDDDYGNVAECSGKIKNEITLKICNSFLLTNCGRLRMKCKQNKT